MNVNLRLANVRRESQSERILDLKKTTESFSSSHPFTKREAQKDKIFHSHRAKDRSRASKLDEESMFSPLLILLPWRLESLPNNPPIKVKLLSRVWLFVTPWTVAHQAPPFMEFSRQEYWSGLPFPSPEDLPDPRIKPRSPALRADALPSESSGKS